MDQPDLMEDAELSMYPQILQKNMLTRSDSLGNIKTLDPSSEQDRLTNRADSLKNLVVNSQQQDSVDNMGPLEMSVEQDMLARSDSIVTMKEIDNHEDGMISDTESNRKSDSSENSLFLGDSLKTSIDSLASLDDSTLISDDEGQETTEDGPPISEEAHDISEDGQDNLEDGQDNLEDVLSEAGDSLTASSPRSVGSPKKKLLERELSFGNLREGGDEEESLEMDTDVGLGPAADKRHYKKDSRYLGDLYTITYQQEDSIQSEEGGTEGDGLDDLNGDSTFLRTRGLNLMSLQPVREEKEDSSGPKSLSFITKTTSESKVDESEEVDMTPSILETNLHKILARRIQEGQDVSFRTTKLLTKAYYNLLRDTSVSRPVHNTKSKNKKDPKLDWETLKQTDVSQLEKIVSGYSTIVKSLSDELVSELQIKENLSVEQDKMLESISDLTNVLL